MSRIYTNEEKDEIVEAIFRRAKDAGYDLSARHCLYCAHFTAMELHERGRPVVTSAGDAAWRRLPAEMDDGVINTHFGYEWSPDTPQSKVAVKIGHMPEIHIWAVLLDTHELIDVSTAWWPQACLLAGQGEWLAQKPPRYYWAAEQPTEGQYRAITEATLYAFKVATKIFGPLPYLEHVKAAMKVKEHA